MKWVPGVLPGCCVGVGGHPAAWRAVAALALVVALWMRSAGRGGSEDEVDNVDEDEDEEEVVVLAVVGCAAMRAGVALWAAAASAPATVGSTEGISPGCGLGAGGLRYPAATWRPGGPIRSAAVIWSGAGLLSSPSRFGSTGLVQCLRACAAASAGGNSSRGLQSGAGGVGPGDSGVCAGGVCGSLVRSGGLWRVGLFAAVVFGLRGVGGGEGRSAGGSVTGVCG